MQVKLIIDDEALLIDNLIISNELTWDKLCEKHPVLRQFSVIEYPGLLDGYDTLLRKLKKNPDESRRIEPDLVVYMYSTYGLDGPVMKILATDLSTQQYSILHAYVHAWYINNTLIYRL